MNSTSEIDPRVSRAIESSINRLCEKHGCDLTPERRATLKRNCERSIADGNAEDFAFAMEVGRHIKPDQNSPILSAAIVSAVLGIGSEPQ